MLIKNIVKSLMLCALLMIIFTGCINVHDKDIAEYKGKKYTLKQFENALPQKYFQEVVSYMITSEVIKDKAIELKVYPSPDEIKKHLESARKEEGKGDMKAFEEVLKRENMTAEEFDDRCLKLYLYDRVTKKLEDSVTAADITETDLKEDYKKNADIIEKVKLQIINTHSQEEAEKIYNELSNGKDFSALAKGYPADESAKESEQSKKLPLDENTTEKENKSEYLTRSELQPEISDAVFNMKPGEISKPIKTNDAYCIFKVEELKRSYDELKDDIHRRVLQRKKEEAVAVFMADIKNNIKYKIDNLKHVAK